jgi:hypothetical protein
MAFSSSTGHGIRIALTMVSGDSLDGSNCDTDDANFIMTSQE